MTVAIVGAGPAGLMAAEVLSQAGVSVDVFDAMPSAGRKFLLAGRGGLNLTHSEPHAQFMRRYDQRESTLAPCLQAFDAQALRAWVHGLGVDTFVGTSGRVFPTDMKAAPLLRAWLHRLRAAGVRFHMRHRWQGWDASGALVFETPQGITELQARATVLALGGASWSRLGSDGAWVQHLRDRHVEVTTLEPANCGFHVQGGWSPILKRLAGQPLKNVVLRVPGTGFERKGECVLTEYGLEGSLIYAASALLRHAIRTQGHAELSFDLLPDISMARVQAAVQHPRGSRSWSSHLKSRLDLGGVKAGLLQEVMHARGCPPPADAAQAQAWACTIKDLPLQLDATRPIDEAISTAGGVRFEAMTASLMLQAMPGVFCAGEMLDWEAPTGGYLLTACMATGRLAGQGALEFVKR